MNTKTKEIVENLKANKELTIVGPSYSDPKHLRIYSYGGLMGGIPLTDLSWWKLPDENYLNVALKDKGKDSLYEYLSTDKNCKDNRERKQNRQTLYSNPEFIAALTTAAKERFTSISTDEKQERSIQTSIVRKYLSEAEDIESDFIICDMEHCVPKDEYLNGCDIYLKRYDKWTKYEKKAPKFDIIAINPNSKKIGFIELKCNESACSNESGLETHLKDTFACMDLPSVRQRIADRFGCLRTWDLLSAGIQGIEEDDIKAAFSDYDAFCGFLFIKGTKLQAKASAIEICETELKEILKGKNNMKDRLLFSFAEDAYSVDLDKMQTWDEFCK